MTIKLPIETYRDVFEAIPEEVRKEALGRTWVNTYDSGVISRKNLRRTIEDGYPMCPIGCVLTRWLDAPWPNPTASSASMVIVKKLDLVSARAGEVVPNRDWNAIYTVVSAFILDWAYGRMTVEEMEAIFA
jgi:hypothetical protein